MLLLMTPRDTVGISRLMQHLGRHYVLYVNRQYRRTGTLWEGRHKASLVQPDKYLLTTMRYIELNPVAAGMVQSPEQYRWSSYRWHAWGESNPWLRDHDLYVRVGASEHDRQCAYRELFRAQIPETDIHDIRECCLQSPWAMTDSGSTSNRRWASVSDGASAGVRPSNVDAPINHYDPFDPPQGPENASLPGRGPVCLTTREPNRTVPIAEKERFRIPILVPRRSLASWPQDELQQT
ncbi:MAG: transposase [Gammaproteobacteria bacterium]